MTIKDFIMELVLYDNDREVDEDLIQEILNENHP